MSYLADTQAWRRRRRWARRVARLQMICTSDLPIVGLGAEKYVLQPTEPSESQVTCKVAGLARGKLTESGRKLAESQGRVQFICNLGREPRQTSARLRGRFRLGVITNCDDDLFDASNVRLGRPFDWVVTAEQARSYKPNLRGFELSLEQIGEPWDRVVHVAQSLYHDHVPAARLGLKSVWVDRRAGRTGFGATPPSAAIPTLTVPDLAILAELATGSRPRPMHTSD